MKIYIDPECNCHVTDDGTIITMETKFFNGKYNEFIERYHFVPTSKYKEVQK